MHHVNSFWFKLDVLHPHPPTNTHTKRKTNAKKIKIKVNRASERDKRKWHETKT